jgi:hypothetical protein
MHPHRMDDRGKTPAGNHGRSDITGKSTGHANCPPGPAVDSSRCSRLASAPPWAVGAPSTADPLIRWP